MKNKSLIKLLEELACCQNKNKAYWLIEEVLLRFAHLKQHNDELKAHADNKNPQQNIDEIKVEALNHELKPKKSKLKELRMKNTQFEKIFESEEYGQILIITDINDVGNPGLSIFTDPGEGDDGFYYNFIEFEDSDAGRDELDRTLENIDLIAAEDLINRIFPF